MKEQISTIVSTVSLILAGSVGVGAYATYEKAKAVLEDPKGFVTQIVTEKIEARVQSEVEARVAVIAAELEASLQSKVDDQVNKALSRLPKLPF